MSIFDFSAAAGPPDKKGDAKTGFGSTVDAMKVGLRAHYAKTGQPVTETPRNKEKQILAEDNQIQAKVGPSVTKAALKTGLKAWYQKHGQYINETTLAPSVGVGPERPLGGNRIRDLPACNKRNRTTGGTSLRADIQKVEQSVEKALAGLSDRQCVSESEDVKFRKMLVDAVTNLVMQGDTGYFKDVCMHASLIESRFIGKPIPETGNVLTRKTDLGETFRSRMAEEGPMVEMIANQLTSGMPLKVVVNNVVAAFNGTNNGKVRQTLQSAHDILLGL
jgi:hypothetical protein